MEYISLIMLLLWSWGIWSFITLRRKSRKVKLNNTNIKSNDSLDDVFDSFYVTSVNHRFPNDN